MQFSVLILSIGLVDFAIAIYHRYLNPDTEAGSIGYAAHIGGGAAGFLIGMNVLRNFNNQVSTQRMKLKRSGVIK